MLGTVMRSTVGETSKFEWKKWIRYVVITALCFGVLTEAGPVTAFTIAMLAVINELQGSAVREAIKLAKEVIGVSRANNTLLRAIAADWKKAPEDRCEP